MSNRIKRSISLPPAISARIDEAARAAGTTPSAWIAAMAARQLKMNEGLAGVAEWEKLDGPLLPEEIERGREEARSLVRRVRERRDSRRLTA